MNGRSTRLAMLMLLVPGLAVAQAQSRPPRRRAAAARPTMAPTPASVHFVLAPAGNEARFIVREQLTVFQSPNDAIGTTGAITGGITLTPAGAVDPANSRIVVDLSTLTSDKENRDRWIKSHTLKTDSFPTAQLVVKQLQGLPRPLPASGTMSLKLLGEMTMHGVTRPVTWDVTLVAHGDDYTGTATTHVKFEDFGMDQPRLMIVVSVVDDVKLEYDFHFVKSSSR